ncbi:hypothetical protein A2U01_0023646, partial [Trifolium medium]|nr:hypothetical protein [Trifolium medium]
MYRDFDRYKTVPPVAAKTPLLASSFNMQTRSPSPGDSHSFSLGVVFVPYVLVNH